jgi:Flp pilus assembly protein TadG
MSAARGHDFTGLHQRGFALVEFVITAPVLLLIMFASFEFSNFLQEYSRLNDAVNSAASWAAIQALQGSDGVLATGTAWSTLVTQTQNMVVYGSAVITGSPPPLLPSLNTGEVSVQANTTGNSNTVTVSVVYPYISLFGGAIPNFGGGWGSISTTYNLTIFATMEAI